MKKIDSPNNEIDPQEEYALFRLKNSPLRVNDKEYLEVEENALEPEPIES